MKASTGLKIGLLVALAVATSLLTSSMVAGSGRHEHRGVLASQAATGPQQPPVTGDTKQVVPPGQPAQAALLPGRVQKPVDALFYFEHCDVTPGPGRITIDACVSIMDSRPVRTPYLWSVIVKDETGNNVVLKQSDDQQVFEVPPGETHKPTLKDTWPLQPGDYFVEVRLNAVAPQVPPTVPHPSQAGVLISGGGHVTVPGL